MPEELLHTDVCPGCTRCNPKPHICEYCEDARVLEDSDACAECTCEQSGHLFDGEVECQTCGANYLEVNADNYDEGER